MPEVTEHAPGTAAWTQLTSPDVGASKEFYRGVFGWDSYTLTLGAWGDNEIFTLGGAQGPEVAGLNSLVDDTEPASWTCYFRVEDLDAAIAAVGDAGGAVNVEPTDIADLGRMALCSDPQGAEFALWLPHNIKGAGVVDEPGATCWVELASTDVQDARRFYGKVFGWTAVDRSYYAPSYTNWKIGDWSVAGMLPIEAWWPAGFPPHWIPYFWVEDCDATAARAAELGATVHVPPTDIRPGRLSVMTDPAGARLAVITPDVSGRPADPARP
ncbi:VOC family protein [Actinomadura sp. 1N219]|uniref:VOC family protein n=1 Tax=Actinomadura sp. 1N219 TaxID=3375152 RepID=UPI00379EB45B